SVAHVAAGGHFPPITVPIVGGESCPSAFPFHRRTQKPPWGALKQGSACRAGSCASSSSPARLGRRIGSEAPPPASLPKSSGTHGGTGRPWPSYQQRSSRLLQQQSSNISTTITR